MKTNIIKSISNMKAKIGTIASIAVLTLAVAGVIPVSASAATVYIESTQGKVSVGDTIIVSVKINADGAVANAVEGNISLKAAPAGFAVKEFSLAGSSFGLWPRTPSLSKDGQTISFAGGVPGGFDFQGATMFKVILEAKKEGNLTVLPTDISVYANDGKGTKLAVQNKGLSFNVELRKAGVAANDEWKSALAGDTTPPEDFIIALGQEPSLFDGKKFAFFSSVDNQTGVDHYEVSENGTAPVRTGSTYVLQDQVNPVSLKVVAYDKAGNQKIATVSDTDGTDGISWTFVIVIIIILIAIKAAMILRKRKGSQAGNQVNKNNATPAV